MDQTVMDKPSVDTPDLKADASAAPIGWARQVQQIYAEKTLRHGEDHRLFRELHRAHAAEDAVIGEVLHAFADDVAACALRLRGTTVELPIVGEKDLLAVKLKRAELEAGARIGVISGVAAYDLGGRGDFRAFVTAEMERVAASGVLTDISLLSSAGVAEADEEEPPAAMTKAVKEIVARIASVREFDSSREDDVVAVAETLDKLARLRPVDIARQVGITVASASVALQFSEIAAARDALRVIKVKRPTDAQLAAVAHLQESRVALFTGALEQVALPAGVVVEACKRIHGARRVAESKRVRLLQGVRPYVLKTAKSYEGRGVPLADLVQEGEIGVLRAIDKFDLAKGFRFLTYSDDWIRQGMSRACTDKGSIEVHGMRTPCHAYMAIGRVAKHLPALQDELGREPTVEELAKKVKRSEAQVRTALEVLNRQMTSMDAQFTQDDSEVSLGEAIADEQALDPVAEVVDSERRQQIWAAFNELDELEKRVLVMKYQLDGKRWTLPKMCEELGMTKSRLSTIAKNAESKLRAHADLREIKREMLDEGDAE